MSGNMVIVGAGHSGGKAAHALRKHGWTGSITLIGNEGHPPYDRPPLSKAVLLGKKTPESCLFRQQEWYQEQSIDLLLERRVSEIDRSGRRVLLGDGESFAYERLLIATGAELNALRVPGIDLPGISPLRTTIDAARVASYLILGKHLVVVGAGFIGLEVAAAAIAKGCTVTVLEAAPAALTRSLPALVANEIVRIHSERGVTLRFEVAVASVEGQAQIEAVRLSTGERIPCDYLVYGVGVRPRTLLAEQAGLEVSNGIRVDSALQTSDPNIFACGDVCSFFSKRYGRELRLESWKNADDQADFAARSMLGEAVSYDEVPWFWSNQYEIALQVAGLPTMGSITVSRPAGRGHLFFSLTEDGRLAGLCGLGPIPDIAVPVRLLKAWIDSGAQLCPNRLTDIAIPLTDVRNFEPAPTAL